jgi:hypothetical protein
MKLCKIYLILFILFAIIISSSFKINDNCNAIASKVGTGIIGIDNPDAKPLAADIPILNPVKEPGPF